MAEPESTFITENTIARYTNRLENGGIRALQEELCKDSNNWKMSISVRVAVLGASGAGKSSLVNGLLGRDPESEGAANVGVTETTKDVQSYSDPSRPSLVVWDTPGFGTKNFPKQKFFEGFNIQMYDFYLVCTRTRFTEDDLQLIAEIERQGKKFYLIRTAIDEDISREKKSHPKSFDKERVKAKIRDDCRKLLWQHSNVSAPVYLVNSYKISDHDFDSLVNQLFQDNCQLKAEAFAFSLHSLSKAVLLQKNFCLHQRAIKKAMEIACAFDDRTKQIKLFDEEIKFYVEQFQIDPKAMKDNKDILRFENLDDNVAMSNPEGTKYRPEDIPEMNSTKLLYLELKRNFATDVRSNRTYDYCVAAFHANIAIMHEKALAVYGQNVFKGIARKVMSD